jgi:MFS family permease
LYKKKGQKGRGARGWYSCPGARPNEQRKEERTLTESHTISAGKEVYILRPGENRPRLDVAVFGPRTNKTDFGILNVPLEWRLAFKSIWETLKTTFFPNVFWVIVVNSIFVSMQGVAAQVGSSVLIAAGWNFRTLGLAVVPLVVATPFVWFFGGYVADLISNAHARRNGGRREPEAHLLSLIFPLIAGIAGPVLFGYAGQNIAHVSSLVALFSVFLIGFGFLTANTLFAVYLVESYPAYAGPVLVNVSSIRLIVGFAMSFNATSWIENMGFLKSFAIYSGALAVSCLGLPFVYIYGRRIRAWTAGRLENSVVKDNKDYDIDMYSMKSGRSGKV